MRVCSSFQFVVENFGCPGDIAEIGVRGGDNAKGILTGYPEIESMLLVDRYQAYEDDKSGFIKQEVHHANLRQMIIWVLPFGDKISFLPTDSIKASKKVADGSLDFIYLDDDHEYDAVRQGIIHWYPKLKSGGYLAGHDYDRASVIKAVDEFTWKENVLLINIPKDYSSEHKRIPDWLTRKK